MGTLLLWLSKNQLKKVLIVSFLKKCNFSQFSSWRGISLLNTIKKVGASISKQNISALDPVKKYKNSIPPERLGIHINTLSINRKTVWGVPSQFSHYFLLVDLKRLFVTFNQTQMWTAVQYYYILFKLSSLLESCTRMSCV